jgi:cytochrome P450
VVTIPREACKILGSAEQGAGVVSVEARLARPVSSADPFSHGFLSDPYPHHEALREAGPVVWVEKYGVWAMARHEQVREALTDWETYCSSAGVGLSDFRKEPPWRPPSIILEADPPLHTRSRTVLTRILWPGAIKMLRETLEREAERLIADWSPGASSMASPILPKSIR